ncbi:MAG: single-stranded DNA-binding protein, partial [Bacteroidales bacterium]|nr:single-stranded DNA-binding protein [Bacteroidales bacterium]
IYVEGRIRTRDWTDKDGNKRYTTEILVDNMIMLGGRRDQQTGTEPNGRQQAEKTPATEEQVADANLNEEPEDDLPF